MSASHIDPERLAALLDGRLDATSRAELLAQLDASPEALEAFADAVAVRGELEADAVTASAGTADIRSARSKRIAPGWWMAVAAVAVIAIGLSLVRRATTAGDDRLPDAPTIVARLADAGVVLSAGWDGTPWPESRGATERLSPLARGVRIGARTTDYQLLVRAQDSTAAEVALEIASMLGEIPAGSVAAASFRSLARTSPGVIASPELALAVTAAEALAGEPEFRAGAWLEGARIAAARRDAGFWRTSDARAAEASLAMLAGDRSAARAAVARLMTAIDSDSRDWSAVEGAATAALREFGS